MRRDIVSCQYASSASEPNIACQHLNGSPPSNHPPMGICNDANVPIISPLTCPLEIGPISHSTTSVPLLPGVQFIHLLSHLPVSSRIWRDHPSTLSPLGACGFITCRRFPFLLFGSCEALMKYAECYNPVSRGTCVVFSPKTGVCD